ncbi:MAG: hypothetical protein K0S98_1464, partial [Propionibacteriaceae bacterium]|nr:hypothetical protein [Propionibacteriaceae bacterium]
MARLVVEARGHGRRGTGASHPTPGAARCGAAS